MSSSADASKPVLSTSDPEQQAANQPASEPVSALYEDFGLARPSVAVEQQVDSQQEPAVVSGISQLAEQELGNFLRELGEILKQTEELKRKARSPQDWYVLMMYLAGVKPRVSEMLARSKRIYASQFGRVYDEVYQPATPGSGRRTATSARSAEITAKAQTGLAGEAVERLERTWRDLQDLQWAAKAVADHAAEERNATPSFDAHPDHLFEPDKDKAA